MGSKNKPKTGADGLLPIERATLEEARRVVKLADGTKIDTAKALIRSQNVQALKGSRLSQKQALETIAAAEAKAEAAKRAHYEMAVWYKELAERHRSRIEADHARGAGFYPHPDDVHPEADGTVTVRGPASQKEERIYRALEEDLKGVRPVIFALRKAVQATPNDVPLHVDLLQAELLYVEARDLLPERWNVPPISRIRWPKGVKVEPPAEAYQLLAKARRARRVRR